MWQEKDLGSGRYTVETTTAKGKVYTLITSGQDHIYLDDDEFEDLASLMEHLKIERRRAKEVLEI